MTVTRVDKDAARRTMSITSELDAPIDRVWALWADPRQLERWWGPPSNPATVDEHDLRPGGTVRFHVADPDGERVDGWWDVHVVDAPHRLELDLGDPRIPSLRVTVDIVEHDGVTLMTVTTRFPTDEAMAELVAMGFAEGMSAALGQIDAVLSA